MNKGYYICGKSVVFNDLCVCGCALFRGLVKVWPVKRSHSALHPAML